jgi:N-acetylmuramoyl-L-alanine amidase
MPYITWLADAGRLTGYPVVEVGGWRTRGHGGMRVAEGVVCHHTAGPKLGNMPSLGVITNGRAGLAGPLANYGLARDGSIFVVAAGCAWHAGASTWAGFYDLNDEFFGIEAEDDGDGRWTPEQLDCYPRLVASILFFSRRGAERTTAHRECCIPKGRKPDPAGIDMSFLRNRVAFLLQDPTHRIPRFSNPQPIIPVKKKDNSMQDIIVPSGKGTMRLVCPVGSASAITAKAFLSAVVVGPTKGTARCWAQSDAGGIEDWSWTINCPSGRSERPWRELKDKTTQVNVEYDFPEGGTFCLETVSK